jgi:hypothetical protein
MYYVPEIPKNFDTCHKKATEKFRGVAEFVLTAEKKEAEEEIRSLKESSGFAPEN